jgi:pimeloyl-ACP methyl ester carboxylesterase
MPFASNRDVQIHYQRAGSGTPVVLLMGLRLPGRLWERQANHLVDNGFEVLIPDNRGTGYSSSPLPPYTMKQLAADVEAVMNNAGVGSAIVAGVSFGGMVAQHVALEYPERVDGLFLGSTTCGLLQGVSPAPRALFLLLKSTIAPDHFSLDEARELFGHTDTGQFLQEFLSSVELVLEETPTPPSGTFGQLTAILSHHTAHRLGNLDVPARVVTGDSDTLVPPENSRILAERIPCAELTVLEDSGHIAVHEHTDRSVEEMKILRDLTEIQSFKAAS